MHEVHVGTDHGETALEHPCPGHRGLAGEHPHPACRDHRGREVGQPLGIQGIEDPLHGVGDTAPDLRRAPVEPADPGGSGLESCRETPSRTHAWSSEYPENPSLVANRTMEGRLVPARSARSETVPNAKSVASLETTSAIRRSVG